MSNIPHCDVPLTCPLINDLQDYLRDIAMELPDLSRDDLEARRDDIITYVATYDPRKPRQGILEQIRSHNESLRSYGHSMHSIASSFADKVDAQDIEIERLQAEVIELKNELLMLNGYLATQR